jgi:hypothetical protein
MRNAIIILVLLTSALLSGCDKDKFTTEPQVKIKDIAPADVFQGDVIRLRGSFTDENGDIDSVFVVYKWYNDLVAVKHDTLRYGIDGLGIPNNTREGEVFVELGYGTPVGSLGGTPVQKDTTVTFGLILLDKAKNRSSYAESDRIRFRKT